MEEALLDYANLTGRPPGRVLGALGRVLPGVADVQRQVEPYAQAWHRANTAALAGTGQRWVVLGDSMSLGIGASAPDQGWVGQAAHCLVDGGLAVDVVNLSASGARLDDVLDQQLPVLGSLLPAPSGQQADVVSVLIGSNDLMSRAHRDRLPDAFAELLRRVPDGTVVATLPQPRRAAILANAQIEAARTPRALNVVDMRSSGPSSWRGRLAADHFHPNHAGYTAIAEAFLPHLRAALGTTETS